MFRNPTPFLIQGALAAGPSADLPRLVGVSLKPQHFPDIAPPWPEVGFFEIHAENYMVDGGSMHHHLERIRAHYPLSIHGVGLSIGGERPLSREHLKALRALLDRYQPESFSEHLAWSSHGDVFYNDLLPVPYDEHTLERVCTHIDQTQEALGRRMLLENPATYVEFRQSTWQEADFIAEVVRRSGCGLLLDVNNAYVSCINHGRDPQTYLTALPLDTVAEIHLAGFHRDTDSLGAPLLIDSHGAPVADAVWSLYAWTVEQLGTTPTLIEWDNEVPSFARLHDEARRAEAVMAQVCKPLREAIA